MDGLGMARMRNELTPDEAENFERVSHTLCLKLINGIIPIQIPGVGKLSIFVSVADVLIGRTSYSGEKLCQVPVLALRPFC